MWAQTGEAAILLVARSHALPAPSPAQAVWNANGARKSLLTPDYFVSAKIALLLEDEALIALDLARTLEALGFKVVTLDRCEKAVHWLANNPDPAVAVIDIQLRDGTCEAVAELLQQRRIPQIVHTASATPGRPFNKGGWLPKPSSTKDFVSAIRSVVPGLTTGRVDA